MVLDSQYQDYEDFIITQSYFGASGNFIPLRAAITSHESLKTIPSIKQNSLLFSFDK